MEADLYFEDWADDMADIPQDVLASACAQYRRSDARWMATPGQVRGFAEPIIKYRKQLQRRAVELIEAKAAGSRNGGEL